MSDFSITIIGAGVIGLAIARELSKANKNVLIIEKEDKIGTGVSSRNSQVIHAGMYYPSGSLKAKFCTKGNQKLYEYSAKKKIPHERIGKYIVATYKEDEERLQEIYKQGIENGVEGLIWKTKSEMQKLEPNVRATLGLYSPNTGIIDVHSFMNSLELDILDNGGEFAFRHDVKRITKKNSDYEIILNCEGKEFTITSEIVINSAGLYSDKIAQLAGFDIEKEKYNLHFCKGDYFRVRGNKLVDKLIYPVPPKKLYGLGIHVTLELDGSMRLGPDVEYLAEKKEIYSIDSKKNEIFYKAVSDYLKNIHLDDLMIDQAGIRPKLQGQNEAYRDFIIQEESAKGFPNFVNLIGIESPGLTCSLEIADFVSTLI